MAATNSFRNALQFERSSVADEYFDRCATSVFETDDCAAKIEVRCSSALDLSQYRRKSVTVGEVNTKDHDGSANLDAGACASTIDTVPASLHHKSLPPQTIELNLELLTPFLQETRGDFRVFYLRQRHSYSRVLITKPLYEKLVNDCDIFHKFGEYVQDYQRTSLGGVVAPPPMRFRALPDDGYECAYGITYMEFTNREGKINPWSLRQFAVHHRFVPTGVNRCSTWFLVGASQRTEACVDNYLNDSEVIKEAHPFELHVIFLDVCIASWRQYLDWLDLQVKNISCRASATDIGQGERPECIASVDMRECQRLMDFEIKILEIQLCLDSTLKTLSTFIEMYDSDIIAKPGTGAWEKPCSQQTDDILHALKEKEREVACAQKKADFVLHKAQRTRSVISSLIARQNGYNLERQLSTLLASPVFLSAEAESHECREPRQGCSNSHDKQQDLSEDAPPDLSEVKTLRHEQDQSCSDTHDDQRGSAENASPHFSDGDACKDAT